MVKQANDESLSGFDVVIRSRPRGREKTWAGELLRDPVIIDKLEEDADAPMSQLRCRV